MMKRILLLTLSILTINCFAQKDPEAKAYLDKAAKQVASYKNICADFEYLFENLAEEKSEQYNGKLIIKGKKFKMDVDKTITYSDGKCRWVYLTESNEVTISAIETTDDDAPEERFMMDPLSLYTLHNKGFKYLVGIEEEMAGKTMQVIELTPEDIKKPYYKIKYWFTPNKDLYQIKCFQKDGTRYTLTLTNFAVNQKLDESELNFDANKYPGIEIINMIE